MKVKCFRQKIVQSEFILEQVSSLVLFISLEEIFDVLIRSNHSIILCYQLSVIDVGVGVHKTDRY